MSEIKTTETEPESRLSRDRMFRLAILLAAIVFVVLYVFVL